MKEILSDSGQIILAEDVELITNMAYDRFINKHDNLEYRYTDQEVCDNFDISIAELDRCKRAFSFYETFKEIKRP